MAFILSPFVTDVDGNNMPKVFGYLSGAAWATANDGANALVFCNPVGAENGQINSDPDLSVLNASNYARFGIPINGGNDEKAMVDWVTKCMVIRQIVPALPLDLTGKFEDGAPALQAALKAARIGSKVLDTSDARPSRSLAIVVASLASQVTVRTEPRSKPLPGGTFTDDFEGESGDVDLATRTGWTRVDGSSGDLLVGTNGNCRSILNGAGLYVCTDQASATQYVKGTAAADNNLRIDICNRATDKDNRIFGSFFSGKERINKIDTASTSTLANTNSETYSTGTSLELQSDGDDAHELFENSTSVLGPVTDAFNNTETRQGLAPEGGAAGDGLQDFEAGVLGAAAATGGVAGSIGGVGRVGKLGAMQ